MEGYNLVATAAGELQDASHNMWGAYELISFLNWGLREISTLRPDLTATVYDMPLVAGAKQVLPLDAQRLIDITRNTTGRMRAVKRATREMLDAVDPMWVSGRQSAEIQHFTYDPRQPKDFYVYPPAAAGAQLEVVYSKVFDQFTINTASPESLTHIAGDIPVPDTLAPALLHFVLHRAWRKDGESTLNMDRSELHYQKFLTLLMADQQMRGAIGPNSGENPNRVSAKTGMI